MLEFFLAGGVPMFGVVVCGLVALVAAVRFTMSPDRRKVGAIASLSVAALASSGLGFAADISTVFGAIGKNEEWQKPDVLPLILIQGARESLSPAILGLALLVVIWLVMAVGYRRLAPRLPAV
jgi:hypothetical protein